MAKRQPLHVLNTFKGILRDCERLAGDAARWSIAGSRPHISRKRAESMVEMAYFRAYLAWEVFLEESFVLYMLGGSAPRGIAPARYVFPPNRSLAKEWLRDGREYAKWDCSNVQNRAKRHFRNGAPFLSPLQSKQATLQDAKTIRNAIAHDSDAALTKFTDLARRKLGGTLPPNLTVGRFLNSVVPSVSPPTTFLEDYLATIEGVANRIVPT